MPLVISRSQIHIGSYIDESRFEPGNMRMHEASSREMMMVCDNAGTGGLVQIFEPQRQRFIALRSTKQSSASITILDSTRNGSASRAAGSNNIGQTTRRRQIACGF